MAERNSLMFLLMIAAMIIVTASGCKKCTTSDNGKGTSNLKQSSPLREADKRKDQLLRRIVKITVRDKNQVNELANMGLDIWEVKQGYVVALTTDNEIAQVKRKNFPLEVLFRTQAEYEMYIRSREPKQKD